MNYRLFPKPSDDICTPYLRIGATDSYSRYHLDGSSIKQILLTGNQNHSITVDGFNEMAILGANLPHRESLIEYLRTQKAISPSFFEYVKDFYVIPTFPLSREEAIIKTIVRQVISARQAKKIFSEFIKTFGYAYRGIYGFPSIEQLHGINKKQLLKFGLGFKAERIFRNLSKLEKNYDIDIAELEGIGPWSRNILEVELLKDYSLYPFGDKSGEKAKRVCGIDLNMLAKDDRTLAGHLYIYAASHMESLQ